MSDLEILERIWKRQADQQASIFPFDNRDATMKHRMSADYALGLHQESDELARLIYAGQHVLQSPNPTVNNVAIAAVDVFKYLLSVMILHGVTPDQFVDAFFKKSDVVDHKIQSQNIGALVESVFITDLDNCIADWDGGFKLWCERSGYPMPTEMGKGEYEGAINVFYDQGGFLELGLIDGARDGLAMIRDAGIKTVIVTARPRWQHERLYSDTLRWLDGVGIEIDAIFWGKDKADIVYENIVPARVLGFVEDRPKHVLELAASAVDVLMFHRSPDSAHIKGIEHELVRHVTDWRTIAQFIINRSKETT